LKENFVRPILNIFATFIVISSNWRKIVQRKQMKAHYQNLMSKYSFLGHPIILKPKGLILGLKREDQIKAQHPHR